MYLAYNLYQYCLSLQSMAAALRCHSLGDPRQPANYIRFYKILAKPDFFNHCLRLVFELITTDLQISILQVVEVIQLDAVQAKGKNSAYQIYNRVFPK